MSQASLTAPSVPHQADQVLRTTRALSVFIVPFLVIAFGILYLFPDRTQELFAWGIKPRMTAMMLGAAYLGGSYFFIRAALAKQWHRVKLGFLPVTTFATLMGIATALHWDKFTHDHIAFYAWVILYFTTPFLVFATWLLNRPSDPGTPDSVDFLIPGSARLLIGLVGAAILLASILLFVVPQGMIGIWPWSLTPLTARVLGAMFALTGVADLGVASDARWSAARIVLHSQLISLAFIDLALAFSWGDFNPANPLATILVAALVLLLIGGVVLVFRMDQRQMPIP